MPSGTVTHQVQRCKRNVSAFIYVDSPQTVPGSHPPPPTHVPGVWQDELRGFVDTASRRLVMEMGRPDATKFLNKRKGVGRVAVKGEVTFQGRAVASQSVRPVSRARPSN